MKCRHLAVALATLFVVLSVQCLAQEQLGNQSLGLSSSYSPNSSHILIGDAEKRRIWTIDVDYSRRILGGRSNRLDYIASISPLFLESDPTVRAITGNVAGQQIVEALAKPTRVILANGASFGPILTTAGILNAYPIYGARESTYAFGGSPAGLRWTGLQQLRIQPTFSFDAGLVYATRSLPVDSATKFNYAFSFGPGIQVVRTRGAVIRLEYLYRHISNANSGESNPGIDSGVFRVSVNRFFP